MKTKIQKNSMYGKFGSNGEPISVADQAKFGSGGSGPPPATERADDPDTGDTAAHAHARGAMARMEAMPKPPPTKVRCLWCPTVNHLVPAEVTAMCSPYGGQIRCSGCGRKQTIRHQTKGEQR